MTDYSNIDTTADLGVAVIDANGGVTPNAVNLNTEVPADAAPKDGEQPGPSLRDSLTSLFKENKDETPKAPTTEGAPADAPKDGEQPQQAEFTQLTKVGDKYHTPDGRFASKEQIDAFLAGPTTSGEPSFLAGMTPAEKAQLTALPEELRQFVERTMEATASRGGRASEYDRLEQVIGPRREAWAATGMTPEVAVNQLFAMSDFAGKQPADFVLWFADQHKLDLDQILDDRDAASAGGGAGGDPQIAALVQEVGRLAALVQQPAAPQQQANPMLQYVEQFANTAGPDGQPAYPYFVRVSGKMNPFVQAEMQANPNAHPTEIIRRAYEAATYADPAIRADMQSKADAARKAEATARAQKAQNAGSSVASGPAGGTGREASNTGEMSLRDELKLRFAEYGD